MKRILYLMHVPWRWVKQRPHYLAEELAEFYEVEVFYRKLYFIGKQLTNDLQSVVPARELFVIPPERFECVWKLNCRMFGFQLRTFIDQYDLVWITNPLMLDMVESVLPPGMKVAYDCMDDALEFPRVRKDARLRERIGDSERKLVERSDIVFTSSATLGNRIADRYEPGEKITVVPNAVFLENDRPAPSIRDDITRAFQAARCRFTYIGTISEWFDFSLILETLDAREDITVFLFGPAEGAIPRHDRLIHFGPAEHRQIYQLMEMSDALIMPFRVDELVMGVDPVKLYEYIFSGKPVLSVAYPETLKFSEFVYLYQDAEEFRKLAVEAAEHRLIPKASREQCENFAQTNTWGQRARLIAAQLDNLF